MRIALCDDDAACNAALKKHIEEYMFGSDTDLSVSCFTSAAELLNEDKYDLYFLDFIMPEMSGADLAVKLREKFCNAVTVCFLTSYERAAIEVINRNINAEAFLIKPVEKDRLFALLDRLCSRSLFHRMILKKEKQSRVVYPQDILYAEASRKETLFHFFNGTEGFVYTFSDIEENYLPPALFCKIHRSYIVNLMHVSAFSKNTVTMKNGDVLPLKREKEFKEALSAFRFASLE